MSDLFSRPCSSCGAPIRFVGTETGNQVPVDAKPEKRIVVGPDGVGRSVDAYVSHFATCPNANQHRSPR